MLKTQNDILFSRMATTLDFDFVNDSQNRLHQGGLQRGLEPSLHDRPS